MPKWKIENGYSIDTFVESDAIDTDSAGSVVFYNNESGDVVAILSQAGLVTQFLEEN